jgi:hypothetical protein
VYGAYQQLKAEGEAERLQKKYGPQGVEVAGFFGQVKEMKRADTAKLLAYQKATDPVQLKEQEAIYGIIWLSVGNEEHEVRDERTTQFINVLDRSNDIGWDVPVRGFFEAKYDKKAKFRKISNQTSLALAMRDQISKEWYDTLTTPWRTCIGPIHPGDEVL